MVSTRDGNLRSGDLAEGFGLELLRPFALIAPVPRPEDVGVDAVCTLTRRQGRKLYAEDSFLVQVKARSKRTIKFEGDAQPWLIALRLPLFWLSVDLDSTTLELYSLNKATSHPNFTNRAFIEVSLDEIDLSLEGGGMKVWLGTPILKWTPKDANDESFQELAYKVLKKWMLLEMENLSLRALRISRVTKWKTNGVPRACPQFSDHGDN